MHREVKIFFQLDIFFYFLIPSLFVHLMFL